MTIPRLHLCVLLLLSPALVQAVPAPSLAAPPVPFDREDVQRLWDLLYSPTTASTSIPDDHDHHEEPHLDGVVLSCDDHPLSIYPSHPEDAGVKSGAGSYLLAEAYHRGYGYPIGSQILRGGR